MRELIIVSTFLMTFIGSAGAATPLMPTFFARRDYTGLYANQVAVADTNGDGIPDLIANQDGYIEVLFGNGDGTFRPGPSTHTGLLTTLSFVAVDLNGDGKIDLAIAGGPDDEQQPEGLAVCLGNGDGTFQEAVFYPAGTDYAIGAIVVGSFDGHGTTDAMVSGESGVWLFTGKGNGEFNAGVLAITLAQRYGGGLAAADFNSDNKLDLVVTLPASGGLEVFLGNGNGTFRSPQIFAEPATPVGLAVGALTKGGYPGIAVSEYASDNVYLYVGNGAGHFSAPQQIDLPGTTGTGGLAIGNLTNDGYPDIVSSGGCIAFGTATGASKPVCYPVSDAGGTYTVALADLRGNGELDIVTDSHNGVSVLLSMGKGKFEDGEWTPVTGGAGCGVTADFNGDGKPDLAVNTPSSISILLGTGNPKSPFTPGSTIPLTGAGCLVTGDLNGDGFPDLLVPISGNPNALLAYLNNGDGTFTLKSTTPTPNSAGYVVLADFNHDGKLDFATSDNLLALSATATVLSRRPSRLCRPCQLEDSLTSRRGILTTMAGQILCSRAQRFRTLTCMCCSITDWVDSPRCRQLSER